MSSKIQIIFLVAFFLTFKYVEPQPISFIESAFKGAFSGAYNWVSEKLGSIVQDDSLTVKIGNLEKLGHMTIVVDNNDPHLKITNLLVKREPDVGKRTNLLELAKSLNLTTLVQKVIEAGIEDVLDHEGKFTLFAPTNEAFARRPSYCDNVDVKDLLKYHVGKGSFMSSSLKNDFLVPSLLSKRGIRINIANDLITANGRKVSKADFTASNGVLHILDDVMCAVYKGSAALQINRCPAFSLLSKGINLTSLYSVLDGKSLFTVFAPTDSAFKKLPPSILDLLFKNTTALKDVLLYHVVPDIYYSLFLTNGQKLKTAQGKSIEVSIQGGHVMVNNAVVTLADATVSNGVVHSIDTVLIPPKLQTLFPYEKSDNSLWNSVVSYFHN